MEAEVVAVGCSVVAVTYAILEPFRQSTRSTVAGTELGLACTESLLNTFSTSVSGTVAQPGLPLARERPGMAVALGWTNEILSLGSAPLAWSAALAKKRASFAAPGPSAAGLSADPARSALLGWYTAPVTVPAVFGNGEFTARTVLVPLFTADRTGAGRFPHVTMIPVRLDTAGKLATYSFTAAGELTGVELGLKSPTRAEPRSTTAQLRENQA
jgi:hypothetical protein